ncbi:ATP-dependent DNA helicase [Pleionea sediminis]|uniref:ATP-dependent DNA helicase n=1 Tax=Pleionea sediminis TaxID=2569479 RepID=UPI001184FA58|nr:ATP-dependent DNA helicase [Pleionea sediminis]
MMTEKLNPDIDANAMESDVSEVGHAEVSDVTNGRISETDFQFSVTELAEFSCRTGDLSSWGEGGPSSYEGIRGHQKLQSQRKKQLSNYQSEVSVELVHDWSEKTVLIRGRLDGLWLDDVSNEPTIEEIKTTYLESEFIPESSRSVNLAQLKIYGWMYCRKHQIETIRLQLTWMNLNDDSLSVESSQYSIDELEAFSVAAIEKYCSWLNKIFIHQLKVKKACEAFQFPFPEFREGQRALCAEVYRSIRDERIMAFEAPTGIGKTVSTLFPAVKAMGEGKIKQIVYLTAKTSGRRAARNTCNKLIEIKPALKVLTITAKEKACFCTNEKSDETLCRYKVGYFDRLNNALNYCFEQSNLDDSTIREASNKFKVCPFSLSLSLVPWVDVVICDFNYLMDPLVQLPHFVANGKQAVYLIDEAHNLIERSCDMYSGQLSETLALEVLEDEPSMSRYVNRITAALLKVDQLESKLSEAAIPVDVCKPIGDVTARCLSEAMSNIHSEVMSPKLSQWFKQIIRFSKISELSKERHFGFLEHQQNGLIESLVLNLRAMNTGEYLSAIFRQLRSVILFSGTFTPESYVRYSLGLSDSVKYHKMHSLFDSSQQLVCVSKTIDMRYNQRDQFIGSLVDIIHSTIQAKKGNYLVSFGSYAFLRKVFEAYQEKYPTDNIFTQESNYTDSEKEHVINQFFDGSHRTGFVITGGIFTEGIDYIGDALTGIIIIGTGMSVRDNVRESVRQDAENHGMNGFDIAYRYPSLQRVLQSAGRVIRSEDDKGVIILIDKRFNSPDYTNYFPDHWHLKSFSNNSELDYLFNDFWKKN